MVSESLQASDDQLSVKTENGAVLKSSGGIGDEPLSEAIRTLFSTSRSGDFCVDNTAEFLSRVEGAIHSCECDLTSAARSGRSGMEAALSRGNSVRDSVGAHSVHLGDSRKNLADVRERAESCADLLEERMRIRTNLDDALVLVANTRKLVRTYARVEDVLAERRLHTALNMLHAIEKNDSKSPDAAKLLAYIYQRAGRLKKEVGYQAGILFKEAMKAPHSEVGRYALKHIKTPGWTPTITSSVISTTSGTKHSSNTEPISLNALNDAASSADYVNSTEEIDFSTPPKLYLRPLLQCVQIYEDLGRSAELQTEYRTEREKQLRCVLDSINDNNGNNNTEGSNSNSETPTTLQNIMQLEKALEGVAGIIVVEKTIAPYAPDLLENSVLMKELWRMAHSRLMKAVARSGQLASGNNVKRTIDAFAKAYSLPL